MIETQLFPGKSCSIVPVPLKSSKVVRDRRVIRKPYTKQSAFKP